MLIEKKSDTLRVFRDDLFPFLGGGNKGRKMLSIGQDIKEQGCNAVVTTGGIQSNHNRALVIAAAQNNWECTLVVHGDKDRFEKESGNAKIIRHSNAKIIFTGTSNISLEMDRAMEDYKKAGLKPYYLWGGGHNIAGGTAYVNAIEELNCYCNKENWRPDYIFLASGTGSTQAGILAGLDKFNFKKTEVVGISVARQKGRAEKIVGDFYKELCEHTEINCQNRASIVLDDYLCGGYEEYNSDIKELSDNSLKNYGFILDTTYSGKAFYGMLQTIEKKNLENKSILFWHTGGILNFLA